MEAHDGFRVTRTTIGGSGDGDERTTLALEAWTPYTVRRGLFWLKRETRYRWEVIEVGRRFAANADTLRDFEATIRAITTNPTERRSTTWL